MARSRITSTSQDAINDEGNVLFSMVDGEQLIMTFTANWLTNMTNYRVRCRVIESNNASASDATEPTGNVPTDIKTNGAETYLTVINSDDSALPHIWEELEGVNGSPVVATRVDATYVQLSNISQQDASKFTNGTQFVLASPSADTKSELTDAEVAAATDALVNTANTTVADYGYNPVSNTLTLGYDMFPAGVGTKHVYLKEGSHRISLNSNQFKIIFPDDLLHGSTEWSPMPQPGKPVYGFLGLEIAEPSTNTYPQVWRPLRGQIQVLYSVMGA